MESRTPAVGEWGLVAKNGRIYVKLMLMGIGLGQGRSLFDGSRGKEGDGSGNAGVDTGMAADQKKSEDVVMGDAGQKGDDQSIKVEPPASTTPATPVVS